MSGHGTSPLVVTGFGPFPGHDDNPTGRLVHDLAVPGEVVTAALPVSWADTPRVLAELVTSHRPHALIGFGIAGTGPLRVETVGHDAADGRPDADGRTVPVGAPVLGGGPRRRATGFDGGALAAAISEEVAPTEVSEDAGRYLCNAWLVHALATTERAVFVHLPAGSDDATVRSVLRCTVDHVRGTYPPAGPVRST